MAQCAIATSVSLTCAKGRKVGGLAQKVWLVSTMDNLSYTINASGYVTAISFNTYGGLVTLESVKNSHSAGSQMIVTEGGNKYFQHDAVVKCLAETPTEIGAVQDLATWNAPIIVETRNREFYIYGMYNGMSMIQAVQNSGANANADIYNLLTFQGEENDMPKRFLNVDYDTTLDLLTNYESW